MKINQEMIHRRQVHQFRQDLVVPIVFLSSVRYRKGFRWDPLIVPCIYRSICLTLPFSLAFFTRPSIESYHASPFVTITQHVLWRMARWCSRKGCKNLKSLLLSPGPFNPYFSFLISSQDIPLSGESLNFSILIVTLFWALFLISDCFEIFNSREKTSYVSI